MGSWLHEIAAKQQNIYLSASGFWDGPVGAGPMEPVWHSRSLHLHTIRGNHKGN
jgi:hypothetical protein